MFCSSHFVKVYLAYHKNGANVNEYTHQYDYLAASRVVRRLISPLYVFNGNAVLKSALLPAIVLM